jgi:hypothetical protein
MVDKPIAAGNSKESAEQSTTAAKIQGFLNSGMSIPLVAIIVGFISVCVAWARSATQFLSQNRLSSIWPFIYPANLRLICI